MDPKDLHPAARAILYTFLGLMVAACVALEILLLTHGSLLDP